MTARAIVIASALYVAAMSHTFGVLMHRDHETCLPEIRPPCALFLSATWPGYWVFRAGYMLNRRD